MKLNDVLVSFANLLLLPLVILFPLVSLGDSYELRLIILDPLVLSDTGGRWVSNELTNTKWMWLRHFGYSLNDYYGSLIYLLNYYLIK